MTGIGVTVKRFTSVVPCKTYVSVTEKLEKWNPSVRRRMLKRKKPHVNGSKLVTVGFHEP